MTGILNLNAFPTTILRGTSHPCQTKTAAIKMAESHRQEGNNSNLEKKDGFSKSPF